MHVAYCGPLWSVSLSNSSRHGVVWQALLLWIGVAADKPSMSATCLSTMFYLDSFLHCSHGCGRVYVMIWCPASVHPSFSPIFHCSCGMHAGLPLWAQWVGDIDRQWWALQQQHCSMGHSMVLSIICEQCYVIANVLINLSALSIHQKVLSSNWLLDCLNFM